MVDILRALVDSGAESIEVDGVRKDIIDLLPNCLDLLLQHSREENVLCVKHGIAVRRPRMRYLKLWRIFLTFKKEIEDS